MVSMSESLESLRQEAERHWQAWQEKAAADGVAFAPTPEQRERLLRVWQASEYAALACQREPGLLPRLFDTSDLDRPWSAEEIGDGLAAALDGVADEPALHRALRRFRREQMVRIVWHDLEGAPLAETMEALSALADAAVDRALDLLYRWAVAKQGIPRDQEGEQQHLLVLGMGKLGARELNLSSDIDLIFVYPEQGQTDGRRPVPNEQFFTRLCQQLIKALNSQTADGFVFRVDTRLRPFGEAGPLAISFAAMEHYYESQAREWERYAMIKARVVAGPQGPAEQLMAMLRPFVYRRYLDFGAIESIRDMKRLISRELRRKGMADNIKLGPGGIREIEFIGQAFQLIRGGRDPALQVRPILRVLELLLERDLLPEYVVRELREAYVFLRLVENRLQAWRDQQTHLLPTDEAGRLRLARAMVFDDWESFSERLEQHRRRVQGHFDKVFAAPQAEGEGEEQPLRLVWEGQLEPDQAAELVEQAGFPDGSVVVEQLERFRDSHACRNIGGKGRERLDQLMPLLLEAVARSEEPVATLERLLRLLEAIARRTAYLSLLVENPVVLSQLVRLFGVSPWIARLVTQFPLLLDEMLDPRRLYSPLQRDELEAELETLLSPLAEDDLEQQMERLRQFANSNKLRVAAADITGAIPVMVVSDYLTDIAETVIQRVLELAWSDLVRRHGRPGGVVVGETGFAVIGYGKLGGIELGYGSDLDMVFLHASDDPGAMTDGERPIANEVFYARLGQRMIHIFTTRTPSGLLYETDMRLRPNGNSGMLVSSVAAFHRYQSNDAWTWEHQALLRARPVAGDPVLMERFQAIRREVLSRPREPEALRREVREMREKMRAGMDRSGPGGFDIKQGRGGIADIEFMVQYCVLRWSCEYPDLLDWTDNIRLLEGLGRHRLLPGEAVADLGEAYRALRSAYHRQALGDRPGLIPLDRLADQRDRVEALWHRLMEEGKPER